MEVEQPSDDSSDSEEEEVSVAANCLVPLKRPNVSLGDAERGRVLHARFRGTASSSKKDCRLFVEAVGQVIVCRVHSPMLTMCVSLPIQRSKTNSEAEGGGQVAPEQGDRYEETKLQPDQSEPSATAVDRLRDSETDHSAPHSLTEIQPTRFSDRG
jgi:hypothetical protein